MTEQLPFCARLTAGPKKNATTSEFPGFMAKGRRPSCYGHKSFIYLHPGPANDTVLSCKNAFS